RELPARAALARLREGLPRPARARPRGARALGSCTRRRRLAHRPRGVRRPRRRPARAVPPGLRGVDLRVVHDRAAAPARARPGARRAAELAPRDLLLAGKASRSAGGVSASLTAVCAQCDVLDTPTTRSSRA